MPGADLKRNESVARSGRESRKKKYAGTNAEKYGLAWLMDPANMVLYGTLNSVNDLANVINPEPGYKEYFNIHNPHGVNVPDTKIGQAGAGLISDLVSYGLPTAALTMAGVPLLGAIPFGVAAGEYSFPPQDPAYAPFIEMLPHELVDQTPLKHLVRHDTDDEFQKRLKQAGSGLFFGTLLDLPIATLPPLINDAAAVGTYLGLPSLANAVVPLNYTKWSERSLWDEVDRGGEGAHDAMAELARRKYTHQKQRGAMSANQ